MAKHICNVCLLDFTNSAFKRYLVNSDTVINNMAKGRLING
jgi:hypothetical protein